MCSNSPMLLSGFGIVSWWMDACPYSHARYICSCFLLHGLTLYVFILTHLDFVPAYVLKNGSNCASLKWLFPFSYTIYKMPGFPHCVHLYLHGTSRENATTKALHKYYYSMLRQRRQLVHVGDKKWLLTLLNKRCRILCKSYLYTLQKVAGSIVFTLLITIYSSYLLWVNW